MLNRADRHHEDQEKMRQAYEAQQEHLKQSRSANAMHHAMHHASACRELTVGEAIDERIRKAERTLKWLRDLKGNLPQNFLDSGAPRIPWLLET